MDKKNDIHITICGKPVRLVSNESEEYMNFIANIVNEKAAQQISRFDENNSLIVRLIFAAINLTDELLKTQEQLNKANEQLNNTLAEKDSLTAKLKQLEHEAQIAQNELLKFIEEFDKG